MAKAEYLSPIEVILEDAKAGRMFILVDDEDRENEGDLVIPAQFADAEAINFMAKYGRGLICLAMPRARVEQLGLNLMSPNNGTRHQTAFTVSIEAREGVTTGISAGDRAKTIATAIDTQKGAADIVTPGHIFPLVARDGGVLVRAGHTEAAVDISRMAGVNASGVICEIMNDDGSMARLPDLIPFAQQHGLHIATIADLIAYRRKSERLVRRVTETTLKSAYGGEFQMIVYANTVNYAEHIALVKGEVKAELPTLVRMHSMHVLCDVLGDMEGGAPDVLKNAMQKIAKAGSGVVVLLREPIATSVSDRVKQRLGEPVQTSADLRDYGIGAQILLDLGVKRMQLLSSAKKSVIGLEGYGLEIVGYEPLV